MNATRCIVAFVGLALFCLLGPRLSADPAYLARVAVSPELTEAFESLADSVPGGRVRLTLDPSDELYRQLEMSMDGVEGLSLHPAAQTLVHAKLTSDPPALLLTAERPGEGSIWNRTLRGHAANWWSLAPPFVAILLALTFRATVPALLLGVWVGATLLASGNLVARLLQGTWDVVSVFIVKISIYDFDVARELRETGEATSSWAAVQGGISAANFHLQIILFVFGLIGMVGIVNRSGGIQGVLERILGVVSGTRSAMIATFAMGLAIFFDDYSNSLIVGNTMRPLTDRLRISREKLAYIVDSTAAPVAGISVLSTWVAYEISMFERPAAQVGLGESPYSIFLQTIPFRFYCIFSLVLVALIVFTGRDFGPMLKAEERARSTGATVRPGSTPLVSRSMEASAAKDGIPHRARNAVLPIGTVLLVTIGIIWQTGSAGVIPAPSPFSAEGLRTILGNADSARALFVASWAGFGLAMLLAISQRLLSLKETLQAGVSSFGAVTSAIAILLLAWGIGSVCEKLGSAHYLIALLDGRVSPLFFPAGLFLIACLVSFSTGSSWSTMSIILPNTVFLSWVIGEASSIGPHAMTIASIGAVLEGSIFGDHCSPISDTTILSSTASGADHVDHVRTQIPYAMVTMAVALLAGYLPAAAGLSPSISLGIGVLVLTAIVTGFGRRPASPAQDTEPGSLTGSSPL